MGLFEIGFIAFILLMWYIFGFKKVILTIIAMVFLIVIFNNDDDIKEERLNALEKENNRLKSDNDKFSNTMKKYSIDPVDNNDREKHKLYKKVFN